MSRVSSRPNRLPAATLLMLLCVAATVAVGHVTGSTGASPRLPLRVAGIDRPFPQDGSKFTFAVVGDKTGGGLHNWPIFDRAIDELNHLRPDFTIMVGDLIQGNTQDVAQMGADWEEFLEHAERTEVPFFFLPGNHDISNKAMYDYWDEHVGRTYTSFDYKACHFVLLNTEEGWRAGEPQLGSAQMAWLREDIEEHRDAPHIFVFMHRPVWDRSGEDLAQWETVESWLEGLPYTVFAGHYHGLSVERRHDRRYFVLSATGAELAPRGPRQAGAFHHYTTVTVDGADAHVAIIEPGSVHPYDVAPREFQEKAAKLLRTERRFSPPSAGEGRGELVLHMSNELDQPVSIRAEVVVADGTPRWANNRTTGYWHDPYVDASGSTSWAVTPREISHVLQPGTSDEFAFRLSYALQSVTPFPYCRYTVHYGNKVLQEWEEDIGPLALQEFVPIQEWQVVGPFDLGIRGPMPTDGKWEHALTPEFLQTAEPEKDWTQSRYRAGGHSAEWQPATASDGGRVDLEGIYGSDNVIAYGLCYAYSPDDRHVLAAAWGDDALRVLVNGEPVFPYVGYTDRFHPYYFVLPLKSGWNPILVKCPDSYKAWGYTLRLADAGDLRLAAAGPEGESP